MKFEYKVIPAPKKGKRGKGVRGAEGKFANALMLVMNELGAEGWEYLRTDTLPSEVRTGLTGRTTVFQNMLVFRRSSLSVAVVAGEAEAPITPETIQAAHARALPSPDQAQILPDNVTALETGEARPSDQRNPRELAAE